jgi:hypothetical protein
MFIHYNTGEYSPEAILERELDEKMKAQTEIDNLKRELKIRDKALEMIIDNELAQSPDEYRIEVCVNICEPLKLECTSDNSCKESIIKAIITKAKESSEEGGE